MKLNRKLQTWATALALSAGLLVGGVVVAKTMHQSATHMTNTSGPILAAPMASPVRVGPLATSYAPIIKVALPEVVSITSSKVVRTSSSNQPFFNDPFFRQFFGDQMPNLQQPQQEREQGLGSGVIIGTNGYILTNNHVIDGATDVKVDLSDKREFDARIVGRDAKTDIAILKINAEHLPAIPMGDSSKVQVGDLVFAIGDPFGVGKTATMGIVSALGRTNLGIEDYEDFIQTDAPINPGNSGGALIDAEGELVGINTAILSRSGGNQGIGFAIPVNMARHVMDQILAHGHVVRGWLGATIQDVTPSLAKGLGLNDVEGVLIADVTPGGPAAAAGLKSGDVVLRMNGQAVSDSSDLRMRVSEAAPGTEMPMTVRRGSQALNLTAKLGELPNDNSGASGSGASGDVMRGIQVQDLTAALREQLHVPAGTHGVVVADVDPSSLAAAATLQQGDVIEEVNHHAVATVEEFNQAMQSASGQTVLLRIMRGGTGLYMAIEAK